MNFERLDWKQLLVFCDVLRSTPSFQRGVIEQRFNEESLYFNETLDFLIELGLVSGAGQNILPKEEFKKILTHAPDDIKDFLISQLLKNRDFLARYIADFLNNFELHDGVYEFRPNTEQRLKFSGVRNFLISLGAISSIMPNGSYTASDKISAYFLDQKKILPYTKFEDQLKANDELGRKAELFILEEEKRKFMDYPELLNEIQHISLQDVSAGYDIKSLEGLPEKGRWQPKYIEVKAVSGDDFGFYWSRNEMDKARQFGDKYYLYLLPVKGNSDFDTSELQQIKNPYKAVFQNEEDWHQEAEIIHFCKK